MANGRKRRKGTGSSRSSTASSPSPSNEATPKKQHRQNVQVDEESDDEPNVIDVDSATPGSPRTTKQPDTTDEEELRRAMKVYTNQKSQCYSFFNPPTTSDHKDKNGRFMIAYKCKSCGGQFNRPIYEKSPTNLSKHVDACKARQLKSQGTQKLAALGVSGTGDIDVREVPQLCAVWCAQAARPFAALGDDLHQGIIHPTVLKNLPGRKTLSRDISKLYTAVQESLIKLFKNHKGAMYLGLDAWQSPNGFDVLGTVIYQLVEEDEGGFHLEAMPLDFVRLQKNHTGKYLAETVQLIVEKFGLKDKIFGIVTDNASNNKTMIEEIKTYRWPRFKGETQWVRCFAHILNLIAQVILRPFGSHKRKKDSTTNDEEDSDKEEPDDPDQQIRLFDAGEDEDDDDDDEDDESTLNESAVATELIDDEEIELEEEDVNDLSDEDDDLDRYTSSSCKASLAKFRAISRKLNKLPNSKAHFVTICLDQDCARPHNVGRDVCTRWNSTLAQLSSIVRCSQAILEWQKDKQHGTLREYHINRDDIDLAKDLIEVLQPFYDITLQVSIRGAARIADIVVFIDQITCHLSTIISNPNDDYPPALRNACCAGLQLTNKYYTLTDCSPLYRVAMVLHPSFKDEYFKLAKWKPEWIQESIRLTREMWETHYKPLPQATNSQPPIAAPKVIFSFITRFTMHSC
ncbi:hypothetical protein PSTG_16491 [Puccinia striiformis f. sp. tritici PST-78]|uniref:DUF659 domain-containing protein n=1 Tax=Puccinia striiformis f. sp. tritici PST-78 TaxID=1165861 RepID=A0A0L0UT10_9BASI|nr:hypothetical protein PSTG_16491 [Puccinia striiformis f. sp. tritici PST-78]